MNPRASYYPVPSAERLLATRPSEEERTNALDLYGLGMTQAIELSKNFFKTSICANACLADIYRHFFWCPFGLEYWFEGQNKAFAYWMDFGAHWMKQCAERRHSVRHEPEPKPQEPRFERRVEDGVGVVIGERTPATARHEEPALKFGRRKVDGIDVVVDIFEKRILA